jgi:hypothetical protein
MSVLCRVTGCKASVPPELEPHGRCVSHFTLGVEEVCAEMRREVSRRTASQERQGEILEYLAQQGALLARVATSSPHLADEMKARILSTFLTLMNLRESIERAARRPAEAPMKL